MVITVGIGYEEMSREGASGILGRCVGAGKEEMSRG